MDPWLLQRTELRSIADAHDLQIDRGAESFDADHLAHAGFEPSGGQRIEQDLRLVAGETPLEQVVLFEDRVAFGLDAAGLDGEPDPSAVLVASIVGASEGQGAFDPRR